ncbi:MAG: single-stranded-DNA-specific exonuclease RecJ [Deltaproteobacteria bacterium]|nr:single-stranded-DNA-specific exonuclease RecJ [Deltaproteobacteria bacterium]
MDYLLRPSDPEAARELASSCNISATIAQVLLNRGIENAESARSFLAPLLSGLTSPDKMADRDIAADRLARAVRARERVAVFGDYDVDGTASAAIMGDILERLGGEVMVLVANRFEGGYGFSEPALKRILQTRPKLVVACDCGSSDHPRLEMAKKAGVDVIVVDHHLVPSETLPALAFLNPRRPDCGFPYKGLASVGLVLSLAAAVRASLGVALDLRPWLDLVALGTIADVAPLTGDNRRLVRAGLALLGCGNGRPGIVALREAARIRPNAVIGAGEIAFRFAPRLNAAGRLGDQSLTLALLRARDLMEARSLAVRVERINQQRKVIERRVTEEAIAQVLTCYGPNPKSGIIAAKEGWHRGVVGISASRLADRFGVPSVVIALQDGIGRGSCRSCRGFPLFDAMVRCREILDNFGGHQAAMGISIHSSQIEAFRSAFSDAVSEKLAEQEQWTNLPQIDVQIDPGVFDLPPASDLALLEPVGEANAEPVFLVPEAYVEESQVVGNEHLKLSLRVGSHKFSAFGYQQGKRSVPIGKPITALGIFRPDSWSGRDQIELWLSEFENTKEF